MMVQRVPYKTYGRGIYYVPSPGNDQAVSTRMVNEFLIIIVENFGVSNLDNIQHFVTFLSSTKDNSTGKYVQNVQQYHHDFTPKELKMENKKWYIAFIPMQEFGMQLSVEEDNNRTFFKVPYKMYIYEYKYSSCMRVL